MIDDIGARAMIAAILKQASDDYIKGDTCPDWCQFKDECDTQSVDKNQCDAKKFIHTTWCAALCDGLDISHQDYVAICIKNHRLSKNTYRYVESEIRGYKHTKRELDRLKNDIIHNSPVAQEIRGSNIGDTTASKAIKISLDKKIVDMERIVKGIESIYDRLSRDKKTVMENLWDGQYTSLGIANKIAVDERTVRRWRQVIIYAVAIELNYL